MQIVLEHVPVQQNLHQVTTLSDPVPELLVGEFEVLLDAAVLQHEPF